YEVQSGTGFSKEDVDAHAKVAVIGVTVAKNLLGEDADASQLIGQQVKFSNTNLTVIGVLKPKGTNGTQDQDNLVMAPLTTVRDLIAGNSTTISQLIVQAKSHSATTSAQTEVTTILINRHAGAITNSFLVLN